MGAALTFMTGMSINALVRYKDVKINPEKRNSKVSLFFFSFLLFPFFFSHSILSLSLSALQLQTWGTEEEPSRLSQAVYWNSYQKNMPEGLGRDTTSKSS